MHLEPQGKLHLRVDLKWNSKGKNSAFIRMFCFTLLKRVPTGFKAISLALWNSKFWVQSARFKMFIQNERTCRFARSPVGVQGTARTIESETWSHEKKGTSSEWTQIYGDISQATNVLFTLQKFYLVSTDFILE